MLIKLINMGVALLFSASIAFLGLALNRFGTALTGDVNYIGSVLAGLFAITYTFIPDDVDDHEPITNIAGWLTAISAKTLLSAVVIFITSAIIGWCLG